MFKKSVVLLVTALNSCAWITGIPLKKLDAKIAKSISNPVEGGGEKILKDLVQYYIKLDCVCDMVQENISRGKMIVDEIKADGGPFVSKVNIKEELILTKYNWTTDDLLEMRASIKGAVKMWKTIEESLRNPTRSTPVPLIDELDVKHIIN